MSKPIIPVLLLTGYLGSGKTTLLNRILRNPEGYRIAVIVNDLGEVNIDAELVSRGGMVGMDPNDPEARPSDVVPLQNGCICCSLASDLADQLGKLAATGQFDYIVIEASGICEPAPIAQTIQMLPAMDPAYTEFAVPRLSSIVTVVDALRLLTDFDHGQDLVNRAEPAADGDLTRLVVDQIEFCNTIILNKISDVPSEDGARLEAIVRTIQPRANIIRADFCDVPTATLLSTAKFDFERVATSAAWIQALEAEVEEHHEAEHHHHEHHHEHHEHHDGEEHHEHNEHCEHCEHHEHHDEEHHHEHHHGHHHHHGHDHAAEFGITTHVYYSRKPFDLNKFDYFLDRKWPKNIIRAKGVLYFSNNTDMSYLFEQAGQQKNVQQAGYWFATAPEDELKELVARDPSILRDWDDTYGDRMVKLVFIGQHLDTAALDELLSSCH